MTRLIFKDVPASELNEFISDLKSEQMAITTTPEDDGQWTVTAESNENLDVAPRMADFSAPVAEDNERQHKNFRFDRVKFVSAYEKFYGQLMPNQTAGLGKLLRFMENDPRLNDLRQCAYILATVQWETAHTFQPVSEYGSAAYFERRYGPNTKVGQRLGNIYEGDGNRFHGRGYVQLTGRNNYSAFNFSNNPDEALEPENAYDILVRGMLEGRFGSRLDKYIAAGRVADYESARRSVNVMDHASDIAAIAARFESILNGSKT